jgi:Ca2+-binding RTX toxin-like protein
MANPTFTYNGHTYLLSDVLTWQEAQNQAVSLGGNLVTINDAAEQAWLAATFTDIVWIGYTDQTTEGTFQWISGETAGYTNWASGEPNNFNGIENYAQQYTNGFWNDIAGDSQIAGIIEINSIANNAPTLTTFSAPVNTGSENSDVTVSFTDLQAKGDETDTDGTVDAFVVKAVSSGTLKIGLSAATATAWDAAANNTVDATHQAYWTPDTNANGTLNAFTVVAKDNGGLESATPVQATVGITTTPILTLSPTFPSVIEGNTGTKVVTMTVTLSAAATSAVTVNYATSDITATAGSDYVANNGVLTFAAGETTKTFDIVINGDTTPESNELFSINLSTPTGAVLSSTANSATVTIVNDDVLNNSAPVLTTPTAINYIDTAFVDNFAPVTGSLLASDANGDSLTYGIVGGIGTDFITMSNAYGQLTVTKATGAYSFIPDSAAMEALSADATSTFIVTVSDGQLTDSKTLVINIAQSGVTESVGNDKLMGTEGNDVFNCLAGDDTISGLAGDDSINGGAGADRMTGGTDNDTYYVDNAGDKVVELAWQGIDTVYSSVDYTLPANVENLILTNAYYRSGPNGVGNALDNDLVSAPMSSTLYGLAGDDSLYGHSAKSGESTLIGGEGNDSYYVGGYNYANDVIIENANEGEDTVYATANVILSANVENLVLVGDGYGANRVFSGTGNALNNHLTSSANNSILAGLSGDDNYYVSNEGAVIVELANDGWDSVLSTTNRTLEANVEELYLFGMDNINGFGNAQDNNLHGNASDNLLDGRAGADFMEGRAGNDTYYVDNVGDVVKEGLNEGVDTVYSSLVTYTLTANVENLSVNLERSVTPVVTGIGNALDNYLTADGRMDISAHAVLEGLGGNDILQSNIRSTSTLLGGEGNDLYYIYNVGDVVKESANQGTDTVSSSLAAYTLTDNVENLILRNGPFGDVGISGTGNELDNHLTGDNADNILDGQAGDDTLVGGEGADILIGGLGKDSYDLTETTAASDTVRIAQGDSLPMSSIYDVVTGFQLGTNTLDTTGVDKLDLASTNIAVNVLSFNGSNVGNIKSHHLSDGIISFDDTNHYANPLTITETDLANVFNYLQANIRGRDTVAFISEGNTFVFQDGGAVDTLVELVGVNAHSVNTTGLGADALWLV